MRSPLDTPPPHAARRLSAHTALRIRNVWGPVIINVSTLPARTAVDGSVAPHLPESMRKPVGRAIAVAYRGGHFERAKHLAAPKEFHSAAAASLRASRTPW